MTIRKQLFLTFFVAFIILGGILTFSIIENMQATERTDEFEKSHIQRLLLTEQLKLDVVQVQQWLTDISATRGQDGLNDGFEVAETYAADFEQTIEELKKLISSNEAQNFDQISGDFQNYYETGQKMAQAYIDGGPE
ncbi:MAG: hypothetical protein R3250_04870, partial [Melioribacteraceae bacterium]|nr:hypothetical protein [Melioribacteraceae bacterium]